MKKLCCLLAVLTLIFGGCTAKPNSEEKTETTQMTSSSQDNADNTTEENTDKTETTEKQNEQEEKQPAEQKGEENMKAIVTMKTVTVDKTDAQRPIVTIEMMSGGIIKAELYPDVAPITVENFVKLIDEGFYNGLTFHRNIPGFVIQGGCPLGNGTGGPGYQIKGEFASNGVENNLKHTRGVLSMARSMMPDSAGSQFFIMHADAPHLDGDYAAFGKVLEGMDVVDQIANS